MRGKKAKQIRGIVYGDNSLRQRRRYKQIGGGLREVGLRGKYKIVKRRIKTLEDRYNKDGKKRKIRVGERFERFVDTVV